VNPAAAPLNSGDYKGPYYEHQACLFSVNAAPRWLLEEWAARFLDGSSEEDIERIIWARCWVEPEKARERCAAALVDCGTERDHAREIVTDSKAMATYERIFSRWLQNEYHGEDDKLERAADALALHWLRALAALDLEPTR